MHVSHGWSPEHLDFLALHTSHALVTLTNRCLVLLLPGATSRLRFWGTVLLGGALLDIVGCERMRRLHPKNPLASVRWLFTLNVGRYSDALAEHFYQSAATLGDDASPCAFFAGVAPILLFRQSRAFRKTWRIQDACIYRPDGCTLSSDIV
jgi:hypothetical protein